MTFYGLQPLSDSLCLTSCPRSWEQSCPNVPVIYLLHPHTIPRMLETVSVQEGEPHPWVTLTFHEVSSHQTGLVFPKVRLEPLVSE